MAIIWNKIIPRWGGTIIEPPEAKKDEGYLIDDVPPAKWENWLRKGTYEALYETRDVIEGIDSQLAQITTERGYITSKTLTSADNLNDVVSNGKYWCSGALNYPETQEQGFLDVIAFGTNFVTQKFAVNGSGSEYFLRNRVSGVWSAWKKVSYAVTPVETVITSGFESGWSGEIRLSKTQENILIIEIIQLVKTTDITANEIVYRLPSSPINFRPRIATRHAFVGQSQDTNVMSGSMVEVVFTTDGYIRLKNLGTITAGVRSCSYVTIVQMGGA